MGRVRSAAAEKTALLSGSASARCRRCILVPDEQLDPALHAGAHQVLRSLEDFDPALYGLPPFPGAAEVEGGGGAEEAAAAAAAAAV